MNVWWDSASYWNAFFSPESRNEVLESVLMETHAGGCLPGSTVRFREALGGLAKLISFGIAHCGVTHMKLFLFLMIEFINSILFNVGLPQMLGLNKDKCGVILHHVFTLPWVHRVYPDFPKWALLWMFAYFLNWISLQAWNTMLILQVNIVVARAEIPVPWPVMVCWPVTDSVRIGSGRLCCPGVSWCFSLCHWTLWWHDDKMSRDNETAQWCISWKVALYDCLGGCSCSKGSVLSFFL